MRIIVTGTAVLAFAALLHCGGEDDPTPIECTIGPLGKTCECTLGREALGFCSEQILGIPSVCCAQAGWPAATGLKCGCDLVVCVVRPDAICKCSRASQRLEGGEEVADCPLPTNDTTRCCLDAAGNCGCYPRTADQCGEGATEVDKCDYYKPQLACAPGESSVKFCDH